MKRSILLLVVVVLLCGVSAARALTARVEVISSVEELVDTFSASAVEHDDVLVFTFRPTDRWPAFGRFSSYALRYLPVAITAKNVADEHWKHGSDCTVRSVSSAIAAFEIKKSQVSKAYIAAHFRGAEVQGTDLTEVLIPLSIVQDLAKKRPNQAPEPTTLLVMPRAFARVTPSRVVAHL